MVAVAASFAAAHESSAGNGAAANGSAPDGVAVGSHLNGRASWYGAQHHGRETASGVVFDMHQLTAAHRTLPFGTRVRVTNLLNGRVVEVLINDRGPVIAGRMIDLSYAAARAIGAVGAGVFPVSLEVLALPALTTKR
jgi:rare lipoprotein A